jgi:YHS domain-containing protein
VVLPNVLTHDGKLVGFCCDKCPVEFKKDPAKYAAYIKFDIAPPAVVVNRGEELAIVVKPVEAAPAAPAAGKTADGKARAAAAAASAKPLNSKCPVSGKPVVLPNVLTHDGKLVGFCCDKCPVEFKKDPAKFAANIKFDIAPPAAEKKAEPKTAEKKPEAKPAEKKPAEAKPAEKKVDAKGAAASATPVNTKCPLSAEDVDAKFTAVFEGKTIGFCCDECQGKFKKDPKKYVDKIVADAKK